MKMIHSADWHLGRVYHGVSLLDDQRYLLDQFVDLVRDEKPDVVLIAGDVYDRSVPPAEAVRLLDEVLTRIVIGLRVPVVMIAGNHDGPDRLGFGARLLEAAGLTVRGGVDATVAPVVLADRHGEVAIYPLPYAEPALLRRQFGDVSLADHQRAIAAQLDRIRAQHEPGRRSVVLAHAFVAGGAESESERPLSVGGSGAVGPEVFAGFDYVALGHLHRCQSVGSEPIHYSGSLLKYSFSEVDQVKSVSVVELDGTGALALRRVQLSPRRDLRVISGSLSELLARAATDPGRDDYLLARLDDTGALLDAMGRLRAAYPNALAIERPRLNGSAGVGPGADHRQIGIAELFQGFYHDMTGVALDDCASGFLQAEIEAMEGTVREVSLD
ncbi:exonuclease SbcCD subunit D [Chitinimonas lacunae]|uniref:Nuclease SbcCD subunit D n=1 Tax=Chitinimonas lacunae TaxID=1963018 RepID=A0ABV8MPH0_9NEIS